MAKREYKSKQVHFLSLSTVFFRAFAKKKNKEIHSYDSNDAIIYLFILDEIFMSVYFWLVLYYIHIYSHLRSQNVRVESFHIVISFSFLLPFSSTNFQDNIHFSIYFVLVFVFVFGSFIFAKSSVVPCDGCFHPISYAFSIQRSRFQCLHFIHIVCV